MCESPAAFGRDFCKRRWESALFADSHGRGISHQAICHVALPTNFTEDPEFQRIKQSHPEALKKRATRIVLGPSVTRVYRKGTRDALLPLLSAIDVDALREVQNQEEFSAWFNSHVARIARRIGRHNRGNNRFAAGVKWCHATKIMALYARELVLNSRYFSDAEEERLSYFLHVPIDSIVIERLTTLGYRLPFGNIKGIDSRSKFYEAQNALTSAAMQAGVPRVCFDDNWGDRQEPQYPIDKDLRVNRTTARLWMSKLTDENGKRIEVVRDKAAGKYSRQVTVAPIETAPVPEQPITPTPAAPRG